MTCDNDNSDNNTSLPELPHWRLDMLDATECQEPLPTPALLHGAPQHAKAGGRHRELPLPPHLHLTSLMLSSNVSRLALNTLIIQTVGAELVFGVCVLLCTLSTIKR